jgi:hypothetical protein
LIDKYRIGELDKRDTNTYQLFDSLRSKMKVFRLLDKLSEGFVSATYPLGSVDVVLKDILTLNDYEGVRVSASLATNPGFSNWLTVGGKAGYGFRDEAWKYGGYLRFNLNRDRNLHFQAGYENSLTEAGQQLFEPEQLVISGKALRNWLGRNFDTHQTAYAKAGIDVFNNWHWQAAISSTKLTPEYTYTLQRDDETFNTFQLTELTTEITYLGKQRKVSYNGRQALFGFSLPALSVQVSHALPNTLDSDDFQYTRFNLLIAQQWKFRTLGTTRWYAVGGWVDGLAPFNRLYYGRGAREASFDAEVKGYFQTMGFNEFAADRFASIFINHNFGPIFYNIKNSRPEFTISHATGVGRFTQRANHILENSLPDFSKGYFESGVGLNNLIRLNYLDVAYLGIGGSVAFRYGPYARDKFTDNAVFRLNMTFSF